MKQLLTIITLASQMLVVCAVPTSESAAEPILAGDGLVVRSGESSQPPEVAEALARFKSSDYDGALKLWKEQVKKNPNLPPAQVIMASQFIQANLLDKAKSALETAIVETPNDPEAYLLLGTVALRDGDAAKAEILAEKAARLMSAFNGSAGRKTILQPSIHQCLADVAEARGDWVKSQKQLEAWLKLAPNNAAAAQRLAYALFRQKNVELALQKLREAAKVDDDPLVPEASLARFFDQTGDRKNAKKWMAAAVASAPKNLKTRLAATRLYLSAGRLDEARRQAIAALRIDGESLDAKLLQGEIANYEMNYESAELFFEAVLKKSPGNLAAGNNLALALIAQTDESKRARALELAEANFKKYPTVPQVASTYSLVLYRLGRLDDAEKALLAATAIKDTDAETACIFARVAADRGRKAEARKLLENALKNSESFLFRQEAEELLDELKK